MQMQSLLRQSKVMEAVRRLACQLQLVKVADPVGVVGGIARSEFVYCPRLFYLEWVQGRLATIDDVEEGLHVHRVVDEPGGDLPALDHDAPHTAGRPARSVWLTSDTLGVSAKLDLV